MNLIKIFFNAWILMSVVVMSFMFAWLAYFNEHLSDLYWGMVWLSSIISCIGRFACLVYDGYKLLK